MTIHRFQGNRTHMLLPLIMAIFIAPIMFLASCSDSEQRLTNGDAMSKVILNLGGATASSGGIRAASAPSNITSVNVTVTGAGMTPISVTDTALGGTIELSVPAGPARLFAVVVTTADGVYSGTAVASLPAGTTVSVPIIMESGGLFGFSNEGSIENPIVISLDSPSFSFTRLGSVGKGKSYYSIVDTGTHDFLNLSITALTDDADLISYEGDPNYFEVLSSNFGQNYCGRTKDEFISAFIFPSPYYFVVDGSHTKSGARFMINCIAHNGMVTGGPPIGTPATPNLVPVGLPYESVVTLVEPYNHYVSMVSNGKPYWVNGYDFEGTYTLQAFIDPGYLNPQSLPITVASNVIFFRVNEIVASQDLFNLEVVTHEGTETNPVELYASDIFDEGRANFCMVGGGSGSSYYRVPIDILDFYEVRLSSLSNDIGLAVYSGPSFSSPEQLGMSNYSGTSDENVAFDILDGDLPDGNMYIKVSDSNGSGATFVLSVKRTIY